MARGNSRIQGFHKLDRAARLAVLCEQGWIDESDAESLLAEEPLAFDAANHMVENAVSVLGLPFGIALNFLVNDRDYVVPMVVEEPSVVAAASHAARIVRTAGGFRADCDPPIMISQIQLVKVPDLDLAVRRLNENRAALLSAADAVHPNMRKRGGGAREIEIRPFPTTPAGPMLVVHVLTDVGDAMGANAVNGIAECLAPIVEELTGGEARLRILSNLADRRRARAAFRIPFALLDTESHSGRDVAERIFDAWALAAVDPYRAATHNKGVMNGIDSIALATGNDWRGIEAGAHAYAARNGRYEPLSSYAVESDALVGSIELPLALGIVGGNLEVNPRVRVALRMLGVGSAGELAQVMAASGLGQNFSAMRAMVTDGIQRGHMALHARGLALAAGAPEPLIDEVVSLLVAGGDVKLTRAREIVADLERGNPKR